MRRGVALALALIAAAIAGYAVLTLEATPREPASHAGHDHADIDPASRARLEALLEEAGHEEAAR